MTGTALSGKKYKAYPEYKTADSKWLDEIPSHWKVAALKHILSTPITDGPHLTPVFQDEGVPFVSAEAVSGGHINFDKIRGFISEKDNALFSQKYKPQLHDVYMIKSGATTGITAIVETEIKFNIWSPLAVMRCNKNYNPYFLLGFLRSDSFQKSVQLSWTFGTQQNIGMNTLENLTVCCPPIEEQQKIAKFLDHETAKIDTLIAKQEKLIELLKEKRQAVISHAVTKGLNPNAPMRDSGVEWLGEVPEHWRVAKLSYFLKLLSGDGITSNQIEPVGKYPVMGGNGLRGYTTNYNCNGEYALIGRQGALCGNVNIAKGKFFASEHAVVVYPYLDFNLTFLSEFLRFMNLGQYSVSAAQPGISVERVNALKIAIPPLIEQTDIGDKIKVNTCRFDTLTSRAKTMIEVLKERKTALISAAVTGKIDVRDFVSEQGQPQGV